MNLTIDDVKHIVRLATAVKYPEISQVDYDWSKDAVDMLYQNNLPDYYDMLSRQDPRIKNIKWGKEIEVQFHTGNKRQIGMLKLQIKASGLVVLIVGFDNRVENIFKIYTCSYQTFDIYFL